MCAETYATVLTIIGVHRLLPCFDPHGAGAVPFSHGLFRLPRAHPSILLAGTPLMLQEKLLRMSPSKRIVSKQACLRVITADGNFEGFLIMIISWVYGTGAYAWDLQTILLGICIGKGTTQRPEGHYNVN